MIVPPLIPRKACSTSPLVLELVGTSRAVLIGIAKPMPTLPLPPPPVSICELIPITWPSASISGPPELPGLIAASVWITLRDREAVGGLDLALQRRDDAAGDGAVEAERVADRDHRVADFDLRGVAQRQRVQLVGGGVDFEQGDVGGRVGADHLGRRRWCRRRRV